MNEFQLMNELTPTGFDLMTLSVGCPDVHCCFVVRTAHNQTDLYDSTNPGSGLLRLLVLVGSEMNRLPSASHLAVISAS